MNRNRTAAENRVGLRFKALAAVILVILCQAHHRLFAQEASPSTDETLPFTRLSNELSLQPFLPMTGEKQSASTKVGNGWFAVSRLRPGDPGYWHRRHSSNVKFRLRGRIDAESLASNQSAGDKATFGSLGDETGLRRARIGTEGNFSETSRYVGEIDLANGQIVLKDLYFASGKVEHEGEWRFGHMREPFSLEGGTSANSYAYMERSLINVLDPARNWGVDYVRCGQEENWTFSGGIFQAGTDPSDFQFGSSSSTALTTKWTGLAWYEDDGKDLMHFGLSISERIPNHGVVVLNQQPQSPLLTFGDSTESPFIPKLVIPARFQELINLQWAYVNGPLWAQAEWYATVIDQTNGPALFYHGSHADLGYIISGGRRSYHTQSGLFGAVTVDRPVISQFSSKAHAEQKGYGAWEATIRMSYLDFVDSNAPPGPAGQPTGTKVPQFQVGLNWYMADRLRIMTEYVYATPQQVTTGTSSGSVLGMRLAMFW